MLMSLKVPSPYKASFCLNDLKTLNESYRDGFRCDGCGQGNGTVIFHCDLCSYDLCRSCGMASVGKSQCSNGHPLIRFDREDFLALSKHRPPANCSCCGTPCTPFAMVCPSCKYYMCPECYRPRVLEPCSGTAPQPQPGPAGPGFFPHPVGPFRPGPINPGPICTIK